MTKVSTWILIASLGCNAFMGAAIATHLLRDPPAPPPFGKMLEEIADTLPPEDARLMRQAIAANGILMSRERHEEQFQKLREAVAADPFDITAFVAAEAQLRQRQTAMGDIMLDIVPRLSPEGRKRLSEFRPPCGPGGPRGPGPGGPGEPKPR